MDIKTYNIQRPQVSTALERLVIDSNRLFGGGRKLVYWVQTFPFVSVIVQSNQINNHPLKRQETINLSTKNES